MGRDQVLGFNPGDWIEVIDDHLELNPPPLNGQPQPGELHKIDSIDSAARTITLDSKVSSANFPVNSTNQTDVSRHTRIRRWDEAGAVYQSDGATVWADLDAAGSTGDIPVPPSGTALILENGITVAFDLASSGGSIAAWNSGTAYSGTGPASVVTYLGGTWVAVAPVTGTAPGVTSGQWEQIAFRTGDFWIFAARTADGSVEPLTLARPFGIQHHYCRLGTVDFSATPPKVGDCRRLFPPLANPCIHVTNILFGGAPLKNDSPVTVQSLLNGINVVCDLPVDPAIITQPTAQTQSATVWNSTTTYNQGQVVTIGGNYYTCLATNLNKTPPNSAFWAVAQCNSPICYVTLDLPAPTGSPSSGAGFNPLILSATVSVASNIITWTPTPVAQAALVSQVTPGGPPFLARLTLKGNFIWAQGNPAVYLNGAVVGVGVPGTAGGQQTTGVQLPSGDGRRSADFEMWFWLISQPTVTLTATAINFTTPQLVNSSSSPQTVTLTNHGTTALTGAGISVSGTNPGDFTVTNTCSTPSFSVAAGGTCTISVSFNPTAASTRTAQINIAESADANPLVIALTGTGIQPLVSSSTNGLVFTVQTVGTTSPPQVVTLTNTGSSQLNFTSAPVIEGANTTDFPFTSTCGSSLQPGQQCTFSFQFEPTAAGSRSATLQIQTNAGNILISLTGTAVAAAPGVSPSATSLDFGTVSTTTSSTKTVTLTSNGNAPLTIGLISITGTGASNFSQSSACGTLQPGQQCTISVVFKPALAGGVTAQLVIPHNASNTPTPLAIQLSGTGETPKSAAKDSLDSTKALRDEGGKGSTLIDKVQKDTETTTLLKPASSPQISAQLGGGSATKTAFITPQERPRVGPQA